MKISRRKFIGNSSLTVLGLAFTSTILGKSVSQFTPTTIEETILQKLKRASDLRKSTIGNPSPMNRGAITNPSLDQARSIYNEVIVMDPNEVRAYDGIRKILLQDKYQEMEVFQLYQNQNLQNPIFTERIAKEYRRIALGNKKLVTELNNPQDLLTLSKELFNQAKIALPLNQQLDPQIQKTERKIDQEASTLDARDNPKLKAEKKANRLEHKNRFQKKETSDLKYLLDSLLVKAENKDRKVRIREIHKFYINRLNETRYIDEAVAEIYKLYQYDKTDSHTLKLARKICNKQARYTVLEKIERENDDRKNNFWSKIALFDVLLRKYKKDASGDRTELSIILSKASDLKQSYSQNFEVNTRNVKLALALNNLSETAIHLNTLADSIVGITSAHAIDRFNFLCFNYYKKLNDTPKAVMTLNIALRQNGLPLSDSLLQKIEAVNKTKVVEKQIHNVRLNYLLNQLHT